MLKQDYLNEKTLFEYIVFQEGDIDKSLKKKQYTRSNQFFIFSINHILSFNNLKVYMADYFPCISLVGTDLLRQVFNLGGSQKLSLIIYGPLVLLISIFNMGVLIGVKAYREPPSDILLYANIFSIIKIMVIYVTMIYDDIYSSDIVPDNFTGFCTATGFLNILAQNAKGIYTIVFCVYYIRKVRNPLKAWSTKNKQVHFVCVLAVIIITFGVYLTGGIGVTPYGYCGFKFSSLEAYITNGVSVGYVIFLIIGSAIFMRYISKIQNKNQMTHAYIRYYFCFLILFCFNQVVTLICQFLVNFTCTTQTDQNLFNAAKTIANCTAATAPFFVCVIILMNGKNGRLACLQIFRGIKNMYRKWKLKSYKKKRMAGQDRISFYENLMNEQRNSVYIQLSNMPSLDGYIGQLKDKNRAYLLCSLLGCLSIHHLQLKNRIKSQIQQRTSMVQQDKEDLFLWNYSQKSSFSFDQTLQQYYRHLFIENMNIVKFKFTAFCPNVLTEFMQMDKIKDASEAISPKFNTQQIFKDSMNNSDGGRSGQFFFFNHDQTLILKTISNKEKGVFISRTQAFHRHFKQNPKSLIVKLYSVFSLEITEVDQTINGTLMGNLLKEIQRKYVSRTYDMKGSTHQRSVLKEQERKSAGKKVEKTLKDQDFKILQEKIWVNQEDSKILVQIIKADSKFFLQQGLIDYSLIVMKVDLQMLYSEKKQKFGEITKNVVLFKNIKEKGMAYILGIIDYLQTWNIRKKGEKWYKSIFAKTQGISSQDPQYYSERFISFCKKILQ